MLWLIVWGIWFGSGLTIIAVDSTLRKKQSRAKDSTDLSDKSIMPWVGILVIAGLAGSTIMPIYVASGVLPVYFWFARKSAAAVAVGVGLMVAWDIFVLVASTGVALLIGPSAFRF